ncbi:DUF3325 domain-containing protein [Acidovorax sp.]|uniref:DUF3325 domain-containing protein n=1 Tax=Acidovorax sp. TaxID=1872122 RepID=UPI002ACF079E|nr:DUF3325 domain-containing protein [Acidovorax sp.]MDZ7862577.1 DUF3325 domain-containing protein [Acidovorax sp.]
MPDSLLYAVALVANLTGLAWLALSMDVHWEQVRGPVPPARGTVVLLRWLGGAVVAASLAVCLSVDHGSMASLVWFMVLAGSALTVAFTLAWKPRLLAPLVAWVPATAPR